MEVRHIGARVLSVYVASYVPASKLNLNNYTIENKDTTMQTITDKWIHHLSIIKRFSNHTTNSYSHDISQFLSFMANHLNINITTELFSQLSPQDIRAWLADRHQRNYSSRSTARALSALRSFCKFCSKYHDINLESLSAIKSPRVKKTLPRPLTIEQSIQLVNNIELMADDTWIGQRNKAFFMLLYGTGLRISEALSLKGDVLHNSGQINVVGKGGKARVVPILDTITKEIQAYVESCPYKITSKTYLFLGKRGDVLSATVAQKALRDYRRSMGLPDSVTPHALRHTCASHLMNESSELRGIQELLGHACLSSTQIYTNLDQQKIIETFKNAHPRGKSNHL